MPKLIIARLLLGAAGAFALLAFGAESSAPGALSSGQTLLAVGQTQPAKTPSAYEVAIQQDVRVPVRDGVKLALDVYLPAENGKTIEGKYPTLLARTPYNKNAVAAEARWFAARGYAVVVNDVRGRYGSEGRWRMLLDDPQDEDGPLLGRNPIESRSEDDLGLPFQHRRQGSVSGGTRHLGVPLG
jgi:dipeptidyl aminopeptidase/acylaminoacyl peptidase